MYPGFQKLIALSPDTLVYPGHEYTLSNYRFCLVCEPDNAALKRVNARAEEAAWTSRWR